MLLSWRERKREKSLSSFLKQALMKEKQIAETLLHSLKRGGLRSTMHQPLRSLPLLLSLSSNSPIKSKKKLKKDYKMENSAISGAELRPCMRGNATWELWDCHILKISRNSAQFIWIILALNYLDTSSHRGPLRVASRKTASMSERILSKTSVSCLGHRFPDAPPLSVSSPPMSSGKLPATTPPGSNSSNDDCGGGRLFSGDAASAWICCICLGADVGDANGDMSAGETPYCDPPGGGCGGDGCCMDLKFLFLCVNNWLR